MQKPARTKKPKARDIESLLTDLHELLTAGLDMDLALRVLSEQSRMTKGIAASLRTEIRAGRPLWSALESFLFPPLIVGIVRASEYIGAVDDGLRQGMAYMRLRRLRLERLQKTLSYPALLFALSLGVMYLLAVVVLPSFSRMYSSMHIAMGTAVLLVFACGDVTAKLFPVILVLGLAGGVLGYLFRNRLLSRLREVLLRIPYTRHPVQRLIARRSMEVLSMLMAGGVDVLQAVRVMAEIDVAHLRHAWQQVIGELEQGLSLSGSLGRLREMPPIVSEFMEIAEHTGDLAVGASRLYVTLDRLVEQTTDAVLRRLEPAAVLILGILIGGTTLLLMYPMLDLIQQLS